MARIETGVDKLVALVAKEKKIEVKAAASRLNVDPAVVQEWAEFLEEEGICSLEFSLSKTFIVEKRLTKTEVEKKGEEYENKKEGFVRRVDATLKQLDNETAGFESIKEAYDEMKHHLGDEMDAVKEEMEQLHHYGELKKTIDHDILKQKVEYQKSLEEVRRQIAQEEHRYKKVAEEIEGELKQLEHEQTEYAGIKQEEHDLLKRIDALQDIIKQVQSKIDTHETMIKTHEDRLGTLRDLAEKLHSDIIDHRKKEIEPMLKISDDQSDKIVRIQQEIVDKVKSGREKMQEYERQSKDVAEKFENFFEKRSRMEQTIRDLDRAKVDMKEELNDLIRQAKAFEIAKKSADTNAHIRQLEGKFREFDRRKSAFGKQLDYLKQIITGKSPDPPKKEAKPEGKTSKAVKKPKKAAEKPRKKAPKPKKKAKKRKKK